MFSIWSYSCPKLYKSPLQLLFLNSLEKSRWPKRIRWRRKSGYLNGLNRDFQLIFQLSGPPACSNLQRYMVSTSADVLMLRGLLHSTASCSYRLPLPEERVLALSSWQLSLPPTHLFSILQSVAASLVLFVHVGLYFFFFLSFIVLLLGFWQETKTNHMHLIYQESLPSSSETGFRDYFILELLPKIRVKFFCAVFGGFNHVPVSLFTTLHFNLFGYSSTWL